MKALKIMIVMLILIMSVGAVCAAESISDDAMGDDSKEILETVQEDITTDDSADILKTAQNDIYTASEGSFTNLTDEITGKTSYDLTRNYKFNNETDNSKGIVIRNDNFVLNGNGFTIDANNQARAFAVIAKNVTINNLTIINAKMDSGSAIYIDGGGLTTNYVNVVNCSCTVNKGVILINEATYFSNNDRITDSVVNDGGVIIANHGNATFDNLFMMSSKELVWGFINAQEGSTITVLNSVFANTTSQYSTAIRGDKSTIIKNSKFINLHANFTAGAISLKNIENAIIDNCTFVNVTSDKNAGVLFIDKTLPGDFEPVSIINSTFTDCKSGFGAAVMALKGNVTISDCNFTDNVVLFDGGAIYSSYSIVTISNSIFDRNGGYGSVIGRDSYGGAIFCDAGELNLYRSKLINNFAQSGSAIYLYDSDYDIENNNFTNNSRLNGVYDDIYTAFEMTTKTLKGNNFSGENTTSLDNKLYNSIIDIPGANITILTNGIDSDALPSRFDLRDWNWVTPVKNQGAMSSCWAFATAGALESAILRYLGISMSLSENNIQDIGLQYSRYGTAGMTEMGSVGVGGSYALAWFGVFASDYDSYDQLGKVSPLIAPSSAIHIQDMLIIPPRQNVTDNDLLKRAIVKYGAVAIAYYAGRYPYLNGSSQYVYDEFDPNHGVTLIGWDDNYSKENFIGPDGNGAPGNGAWIIKNSWGENVGDNGYFYISYYDVDFATKLDSYAFIINNSVPYNKNYQADVIGSLSFLDTSWEYKNVYEAFDDDLIAGVGTYFNQSGAEYTVEIYVNDALRHTQSGISPYYGFHTIQLDTFVPVKKGDVFAVKIKSNNCPVSIQSRLHYPANTSFYFQDGEWKDISLENYSCIIKAYTVADDCKIINNENITVDYGSGSAFSVKVVTADGHAVGTGAAVNFTINGKTTTAFTDADGIAKVEITDVPGTYEVTTAYNNQTYKNSVAVKLNPSTFKIAENKDIAVDYDGGKYFSVKIVSADGKVAASGVSVKFTINGKSTTVQTDANGIAKIKITDVPKKYTMETTFDGKSVKNTVTVKQVLKAKKVTVKKTAKKFALKATLKINGKVVKGKTITFKFNGKTYKVKTNKKGVAQKTLNRKVIKKLKKGRTYAVKVTYLKDTIKTTVKVK